MKYYWVPALISIVITGLFGLFSEQIKYFAQKNLQGYGLVYEANIIEFDKDRNGTINIDLSIKNSNDKTIEKNIEVKIPLKVYKRLEFINHQAMYSEPNFLMKINSDRVSFKRNEEELIFKISEIRQKDIEKIQLLIINQDTQVTIDKNKIKVSSENESGEIQEQVKEYNIDTIFISIFIFLLTTTFWFIFILILDFVASPDEQIRIHKQSLISAIMKKRKQERKNKDQIFKEKITDQLNEKLEVALKIIADKKQQYESENLDKSIKEILEELIKEKIDEKLDK